MANDKKKKKAKKARAKAKTQTGTTDSGFSKPRIITSQKVTSGPMPSTKKAHVQSACSILDPFCVHAKGARRPDGLGTNTLPFQVRQLVGITTGAAGARRYLIVPGCGVYGYSFADPAAGTITMPATWTTLGNGSFISTNASEVRIVSFGVRMLSVLPATTSSGYVIVGTVANPTISQVQAEGRVTYPEHSLRPLTAGSEFCWVSKPTGAGAHAFRPVSGLANNMSDFDWTALSIEIAGGPNSTLCFMAEVIVNVELTLKESESATHPMAQIIPPTRPTNPVATTVQTVVHSQMPSFIEQPLAAAGKFIEEKAGAVVEGLLSKAMAFLPF
jgi:hypothetical protein